MIILKRLFSFLLTTTILMGACGCMNKDENVKINFSEINQEDKIKYVKKEISEKYGIDCSLSNISQRRESAIKNEELYFATATTEEEKMFNIWIDKAGNIIDTYFVIKLENRINEMVKNELNGCFSEFTLFDIPMFNMPPKKTYSEQDDIIAMLTEDNVTNSIYLVVEKYSSIADDKKIKEALQGFEGIVYIYKNKKPITITSLDMIKSQKCFRYILLN